MLTYTERWCGKLARGKGSTVRMGRERASGGIKRELRLRVQVGCLPARLLFETKQEFKPILFAFARGRHSDAWIEVSASDWNTMLETASRY